MENDFCFCAVCVLTKLWSRVQNFVYFSWSGVEVDFLRNTGIRIELKIQELESSSLEIQEYKSNS